MGKRVAAVVVDVCGRVRIESVIPLSESPLRPYIQWIHARHEEAAAFVAGAEAHLIGKLAV
jgi:pyruvate dehydrogenase (quinone)